MIDKLQSIIDKYNQLSGSLSDPEIISNSKKFAKIAKEHNSLIPIVEKAKIIISKSNVESILIEINENREQDNIIINTLKKSGFNSSFFNLLLPFTNDVSISIIYG